MMILARVLVRVGVVVAICLLTVLHLSLLFCTDPALCLYPVPVSPTHPLALRLKRLLAQSGQQSLRRIQRIANFCLFAEVLLLMYFVLNTIRNNLWMSTKILLLTFTLLYCIFKVEQYGLIDANLW
jgi:hypothetical protein